MGMQFDLLVGVKVDGPTEDGSTTDGSTTDGSEMFHVAILVKSTNEDICLDKAVLAEHVGDSLEKPDSSSTLQPIVKLLSVSQLYCSME